MNTPDKFIRLVTALLTCLLFSCGGSGGGSTSDEALSTSQQNILQDLNGDGLIKILAFGDSITKGIGDNRSGSLRGYPLRLENILNVTISVKAVNGEDLVGVGLPRLEELLKSSGADIVILDEGNSDVLDGISISDFQAALEEAVDQIQGANKIPVLINQYPTCCDMGTEFNDELDQVNQVIGQVAASSGSRVADIARAWRSTCDSLPDCFLITHPEGLHPNEKGYDVIAQVVLATLSGIDIFSPDGATALETAYGLTPGTVIVSPDE